MHLDRGVGDQRSRRRRHAFGAHVYTGVHVARDGPAHQVRHRRAADHQAAGLGGETQQLGAPAHDLLLDLPAAVVPAGQVRVPRSSEERSERPHHRAGPHVPAPEPRVVVAHQVGVDDGAVLGVRRVRAEAVTRHRRLERGPGLVGHRAPHGAFAKGSEIVEGVVDHAVRQAPQVVLIHRVERLERFDRLHRFHPVQHGGLLGMTSSAVGEAPHQRPPTAIVGLRDVACETSAWRRALRDVHCETSASRRALRDERCEVSA